MTQLHNRPWIFRLLHKFVGSKSKQKGRRQFALDKRQKFGIGVAVCSIGIFIAQQSLNGYEIIISLFLAILSDFMLLWAVHDDLSENFSPQVFILPFLYSLSFGLFSFLTPGLLRTRVFLTILYALGLYSTFLSENIFIVAIQRTIALLHSARIVSLIISLVTYFFLLSTTLSLRVGIIPQELMIVIFTLLITLHAIWTYTLEKSLQKNILWTIMITLCIFEISIILWFWPATPAVSALFVTSIWYVFTGLTHVWFDKRLFRNVLWEYVWVGMIGIFILLAFTKWR